nr:hypothetical protein [Tanacetum cinerariifolium]
GNDVIVISSDKVEGSGYWNSPEYQDTAASKGKKVVKTLGFYRMETNEISELYIAPCFINGLEAYDGEVNLEFDENLILNVYAVKLYLDYEVKKRKKMVKKELIVDLKGELYFVKFIINPNENDFEPGVILGRSFLRLAYGVVDFGNGVITIYPEPDPFKDDSEKIGKSSDNWDQLLDFNFDDVPKFGKELPPFICKTRKSNHNKKRTIENLNLFYQDIRPYSSAGGHLTQGEAEKEALAIRISQKFALLEEERHDAMKRIKGEALKEKDDPGAFIFPIRLEGKVNKNALADTGSDINTMPYRIYKMLGREEMKKIDKGITMINHTQAEAMGKLSDVLCQVGVTTIIAKFLILDIPIDPDAPIIVGQGTAKSDSDDEEEYVIKRNSVWKKEVNFLGSLHMSLKQVNWKPDYKGSYTKEEEATGQLRTKIRLTDPYGNICLQGFTTKKMDQKLSKKDVAQMLSLDDMLRIRLHEARLDEEIFTSVAWIRAFNINEPIYVEIFHEFYSTYEFDEVCASDELQSKKIIRFRLGVRAHNLTLLEFTQRLGLYQVTELEEEGFNVYFEGGLHSDEHFNAQDYWLSISREEHLGLSRSHTSTIRNPILRVIHKMITYGLCQRTTGYDKIQKNDLWLLKDMVSSLIAPIYCRDLDTTTLRDMINSDGKLILMDPQSGVPRVGIPRPPKASMQDLYDRIGRMEIRQEAIEHMEYRQSYNWD